MAKFKVIPIDLYSKEITVFIGTHNEFKDWIKQNKDYPLWEQFTGSIIKSEGDEALASYWYSKYGNGIIELMWHPKSPEEIAIAAHESLHATFRILDYIGAEYISGSSNEPFTYLHEYILKKVLDYDNYELINI